MIAIAAGTSLLMAIILFLEPALVSMIATVAVSAGVAYLLTSTRNGR